MNGLPIRILIVDDHPVLRAGLAAIVEGQSDMSVVGEAGDGAEGLDLFARLLPDITLMDLQMPQMGGVEAISRIREKHGQARILVLTTYAGDVQATRALKAGAAGYLLKNTVRRELVDVIRAIHAGRRHIPADIAQEIVFRNSDDGLSEREVKVLSLASDGRANKEIARMLEISEDTVKAHMRNIFSKLDVVDRTQAVTVALRRGIISL